MESSLKILISSHNFYPMVGGIETVTEIIAGQFMNWGHEVKVITQTPGEDARQFPYPVLRQPSSIQIFEAVRWCDVFLHNNISLQTAWPLLIVRRPWIIAHHVWIHRPSGQRSWQDKLKRMVLRFATNLTISRSISEALPVESQVIGDPYRDDLFRQIPGVKRDRELIYLGRLVSDKGVDVLLQAMIRFRENGERWRLTVVGDGEERERLENLCSEHQLEEWVSFIGTKRGEELVELLNQHQILVIPSRWEEPFGIVALEGIACGGLVIGSAKGGLKDAIGSCGLTFSNGNVDELAAGISRLMHDPELAAACRSEAPRHLANFTREAVAQRYLNILIQRSRKSA